MKLSIIFTLVLAAMAAMAWGCDEGDEGMTCEECDEAEVKCYDECIGEDGGSLSCWLDNCAPALCDCLWAADCESYHTAQNPTTMDSLCQDY